jgi:hypothetical protein
MRDFVVGNGDQQGLDLDIGGGTEACWCLSWSDIPVLTEIKHYCGGADSFRILKD